MPTFQPESVHLGATLIAQTQGDISKARRAATHAARWLEHVDPDYKPDAPAQTDSPEDDGDALAEALALADGFRAEADTVKASLAAVQKVAERYAGTLNAIESALPDALVKRANGDLAEAVRILVDVAERLRQQTNAKPATQAPSAPVVPAKAPEAPKPVQTIQAPQAAPQEAEDGMVPEDDPRIPAHVKTNRALLLFQRKRLWKADQAAANAID